MEYQNENSSDTENQAIRLQQMKRDLEGWREVLLPLNGLLHWEKPYYPAIIVGVNSFIFALIWYFEPSVLTTFALLGLAISLIDFLVPIIGPNIVTAKWTRKQEEQYSEICCRLLNAKTHFHNAKVTMSSLKAEKPKIYFLMVMGTLIALAWLGSWMDNLCMTYFLVNLTLLIPGIRQHAVLQKYLARFLNVLKSFIGKGSKKMKSS
ncbi:ADP-ribosylation factor-like protein 6-interacting protein 1 isoform X2 [Ostrea edulis]|uniref:ADP-ribosylation factor-like protein 6-interacting protein 1 isoform X2 n=1 Tax=Ostrea edulis TaxID=37623 RepID=UPI0020948D26|nr:ADP-ribosylation factor-like protein 6-interacting protein 1 isoform X2 [Ostrea edulis]